MSLIFNGTTIASNYTVSFNGTNLTAIVYNGTQVWTSGTYSLVASVFNSSGTFTVPSGVTSIVVACTGGGGGGLYVDGGCGVGWYYGGSGSGRTSATFSVTPGQTYSVTVGSGGASQGGTGGTSSFSTLSCSGGYCIQGTASGVSGGANAGSGSSNCPAILTLSGGAVDTTGGLYTAKSYSTPANNQYQVSGGAGCYGIGSYFTGTWSDQFHAGVQNSGAGAGANANGLYVAGSAGKVVVFYYTYL